MDRDKHREEQEREEKQGPARNMCSDDPEKPKENYREYQGPSDSHPEEWQENVRRDRNTFWTANDDTLERNYPPDRDE